MTGYVDVRAYAELNDFLPPSARGTTVRRPFRPHQTVKDVLEAMGIPHTELDLVLVDGEPVDFAHRPSPGDRLAAYPVFEAFDISAATQVRAAPLREPRFVADVHVGRLAQLLRLLGLDTVWANDLDDETLATIGHDEHRVVLTRDRNLLKRTAVTHGLFVRSSRPLEQAIDVVDRLDLGGRVTPFTRCLRCNATLGVVTKADVVDRLEPRTRRYYDEFRRCTGCGQIYWRGSHHARLAALVDEILAGVSARRR